MSAVLISKKKVLVVASGIVMVAAFASMVSSAYTANHIKKAACTDTKNANRAHTLATTSAVIDAVLAVGGALAMIKYAKRAS